MQKLIITRGLPGSGKTHWALQQVNNTDAILRVNRDEIRFEMGYYGVGSRAEEKAVTEVQNERLRDALANGFSVVDDNTNLNPKYHAKFKELANEFGAGFVVKDFTDVDVWTCMVRDMKRTNTVGADVIANMARRQLGWSPPTPVWDPSKPDAVLVDADGTLCDMEGVRGPYEWDKVGLDKPHQHIVDLVKHLRNIYRIVVVTGRDGSAYQDTKDWLDTHKVPYEGLFIRPEGNTEPDWKIKQDIYNNDIAPFYNVKFTLDDRDSMVHAWRYLMGLPCLQVQSGAF